MKIINEGLPLDLKFGKNKNLDKVTIISSDSTGTCNEYYESTNVIQIKNEEIIESQCSAPKVLILSTSYQAHNDYIPIHNTPMIISTNGEFFQLTIL